ncbi:hypothetical protein QBC41DRAFT_49608 [Cercophora samala]|uniref:Uncharacterized protein n=1 Tax=Cercophora samala TaxID=330535 RepID=A0AA39ZIL3_9PEZI|nr:hypothetical protein QBC41DRAFT_49608 [Cercophora samala]
MQYRPHVFPIPRSYSSTRSSTLFLNCSYIRDFGNTKLTCTSCSSHNRGVWTKAEMPWPPRLALHCLLGIPISPFRREAPSFGRADVLRSPLWLNCAIISPRLQFLLMSTRNVNRWQEKTSRQLWILPMAGSEKLTLRHPSTAPKGLSSAIMFVEVFCPDPGNNDTYEAAFRCPLCHSGELCRVPFTGYHSSPSSSSRRGWQDILVLSRLSSFFGC